MSTYNMSGGGERRIHGALRIVFFFLTAFFLAAFIRPDKAYADIASGTSGTCSWVIDNNGVLTISPTDGVSGQLASTTGSGPFYNYRTRITKVMVEPGVRTNTRCYRLFYNLSVCTEMDLSNLDTSAATEMGSMFSGCSGLTSLDVSGFDTGNVTGMSSMFHGCSRLASLNVSGWNTGNVIRMEQMFYNCSRLTSLDVSGWNTGNVTNMSYMFSGCSALTSLDVSRWDTGNVTNMQEMFSGCAGLTSLDVSGWNTGNVTSMSYMFNNCSGLTSLDVSGFDTGNVTNMSSMFYGCSGLTSLDVSGFDTGNVTNMYQMFYNCSGLTSLDASGWDTGNVTNMSYMFSGCSALTSLDVSGFDTGNVTSMQSMFQSCSGLTSLDVSGFDTGNVTNMYQMFYNCSGLTSLDLSGWDTGNVTNMQAMFYGCSGLTSLDVSGFDTGKVTNMSYMFSGCSGLTSLDLSGWDTGNATRMGSMFSGCSSLSEINLGPDFSFKGKNITSTSEQAILPTPPSSANGLTYTRKWIREDGSIPAKTPVELRSDYGTNAAAWAGLWIWEEVPTTYTIRFVKPDETYAGSMANQKLPADTAGVINKNTFAKFNYHFDHWDGNDGRTYEDEDTIPANRFAIGDTLILTAVFEKDDNSLAFSEGRAVVDLLGGEKITLTDIPGGTTYQILEETPSGWQIVDQSSPAGSIPANGAATSTFTNEYVPGTATISLYASKTLDGMVPSAGMFSFELYEDGELIETASNDGNGIITFQTLTFTQPAVKNYSIREIRGSDDGISYDSHTENFIITVTDDGLGNLSAESSLDGRVPAFVNETKPGKLTLTKQTDGSGTGDEVFTFEVVLTNELGQPLSGLSVIQ